MPDLHIAKYTVSDGASLTLLVPTVEDFSAQVEPGSGGSVAVSTAISAELAAADFTALTNSPFSSATRLQQSDPISAIRFAASSADATVRVAGPQPLIVNSAPSFGTASVSDRTYTVTHPIDPLIVPRATGGNGGVRYTISGLPTGLVFNPKTRRISGTPAVAAAAADYTVTATDDQGETATLAINITVEANTAVHFNSAQSAIRWRTGISTQSVVLGAATGGNGTVTYSLDGDLPGSATFTASTRTLASTAPFPAAKRTLTLVAIDETGQKARNDFAFEIVETPEVFFPPGTRVPRNEFVENATITGFTLPAAEGGWGALTYSMSNLPTGLVFDADHRTLSGAATVVGRSTVMYTATDEAAQTATLTFEVRVIDNPPRFSDEDRREFVDHGVLVYTEGRDITPMVFPEVVERTGDRPITYSITPTVPSGMSFDATTRTLSGQPGDAQDPTEYAYTATDQDNETATITFQIQVVHNPPRFAAGTVIANIEARVGITIPAVQLPDIVPGTGQGLITHSLLPLSLPDGLEYHSGTYRIDGTPREAAAARTYTWRVSDAHGDKAELTFTVTVTE